MARPHAEVHPVLLGGADLAGDDPLPVPRRHGRAGAALARRAGPTRQCPGHAFGYQAGVVLPRALSAHQDHPGVGRPSPRGRRGPPPRHLALRRPQPRTQPAVQARDDDDRPGNHHQPHRPHRVGWCPHDLSREEHEPPTARPRPRGRRGRTARRRRLRSLATPEAPGSGSPAPGAGGGTVPASQQVKDGASSTRALPASAATRRMAPAASPTSSTSAATAPSRR